MAIETIFFFQCLDQLPNQLGSDGQSLPCIQHGNDQHHTDTLCRRHEARGGQEAQKESRKLHVIGQVPWTAHAICQPLCQRSSQSDEDGYSTCAHCLPMLRHARKLRYPKDQGDKLPHPEYPIQAEKLDEQQGLWRHQFLWQHPQENGRGGQACRDAREYRGHWNGIHARKGQDQVSQQAQRWVGQRYEADDPPDPGPLLTAEGACDHLNLPSCNDIVEKWMSQEIEGPVAPKPLFWRCHWKHSADQECRQRDEHQESSNDGQCLRQPTQRRLAVEASVL
mmetsp:Transcript_43426/g.101433  ORF Transcript_43426/g.101433 Transcript_43426/m.101433 type:complete len:280 (-) Transcript_43426:458-1297(-)